MDTSSLYPGPMMGGKGLHKIKRVHSDMRGGPIQERPEQERKCRLLVSTPGLIAGVSVCPSPWGPGAQTQNLF